jgi:uncharacterized protein (DUF3820 family)
MDRRNDLPQLPESKFSQQTRVMGIAMRIPFGKYRGTPIDELPLQYIEWLIDQDFLRQPLRSALEAEFERRRYSQQPDQPEVDLSLIDELVSAGVRTLSKKYHPDLGGDHDLMVALNNCAEWLRQQARRIAA